MQRGWLTLLRIRGVPVRFHWSVPLVALLMGRFRIVPGYWLGTVAVLLVHELGHAACVRAARARVTRIDVSGFGGLCHWRGEASTRARAWIAWGGVLAQIALFVAVFAAISFARMPRSSFAADLVDALLWGNAWLALVTLLPLPPLDGATAWPLLPKLFARRRPAARASRIEAVPATAAPSDRVRAEMALLERIDRDEPDVSAETDRLIDSVVEHAVLDRTRGIR